MSFKSNFLKNNFPGVVNTVFLRSLDGGAEFRFHPFIEGFKHVITPKIDAIGFGPLQTKTYRRTGVAEEAYQVSLALPAVDEQHARSNWSKVERLLRTVNPSASQLISSNARYSLKISPLIPKTITGLLVAVDEEVDLEAGFINGYPKLVRLSFTFQIDKLQEALNSSGGSFEFGERVVGGDNISADKQPAAGTNLADRKKTKSANDELELSGLNASQRRARAERKRQEKLQRAANATKLPSAGKES